MCNTTALHTHEDKMILPPIPSSDNVSSDPEVGLARGHACTARVACTSAAARERQPLCLSRSASVIVTSNAATSGQMTDFLCLQHWLR